MSFSISCLFFAAMIECCAGCLYLSSLLHCRNIAVSNACKRWQILLMVGIVGVAMCVISHMWWSGVKSYDDFKALALNVGSSVVCERRGMCHSTLSFKEVQNGLIVCESDNYDGNVSVFVMKKPFGVYIEDGKK